MLFSFNELKKLSGAPESWKVEDMVSTLNKIGFEVEGFKKFVDSEGAMFGKLLKVYKHTEGDKLFVCETQFSDKKRTILTTSTNTEEGKYVVAFVPGARVGKTIFKEKILMGALSEGMLVALDEFNVDPELVSMKLRTGIWIFDEADLNSDPLEVLNLNDYIIEIDLLSNRSDAQSYWVIATEIAASLNNDINIFETIKKSNIATTITVKKGSADLLSYAEANINNLVTPYEDEILLIKSGVKVVSPIVNLTNLALIMTGQPVHAYDSKKVGKQFTAIIGNSKEVLLGKTEIEFKDGLLIKDENEFISAAGVMGFKKNSITPKSTDVIIEIGNFNIKQVRKTAKQTKLDSMSSRQSSKALGIGTQELAWAYISNKLDISKVIGMEDIKLKEVNFSIEELEKVIGHKLESKIYNEIISKMSVLGFIVKENKVIVPTYRHDIISQQDINEEFIRLYGYDNFKPKAPLISPANVIEIKHKHPLIAAMGYQEVCTYSLISKEKNVINPFNFKETIELQTFVSKEREVIRDSMANSLLEVIKYNAKRKMDSINIFDIGQINDGILVIGLASTTKTFAQMKQDVLNILKQDVIFERINNDTLHPGVTAKIMFNNKMIGWIGKIHPAINSTDAFIAEFKVNQGIKNVSFNKYDENQMKTRSITFELGLKEDIGPTIKKLQTNAFSVKVSDIYIKDSIKKVTVQVIGTSDQIKVVDNIFYKSYII